MESSSAFFHRQKRLGRKDMHTLYDAQFHKLEGMSIDKLKELANDRNASRELREKAWEVLRKKLDPQDRDAIEM